VIAFESAQPILNFGGIRITDVSDDAGLELIPLDARGREHQHFTFVELIDAALDDAACRLGQIAADRIHTPRQAPLAGGLSENALFSKVFHQVGHERGFPSVRR
jgi:hypothetical protein